jgi:hypothetical protein
MYDTVDQAHGPVPRTLAGHHPGRAPAPRLGLQGPPNRCTRSMNGHILHRCVVGRSPFSSHQPIPACPVGLGRSPVSRWRR